MLILISDAFGPELPDTLTRFGEVTTDKDRLGERGSTSTPLPT
jgi:hypothetical protein